MILRGPGDAIEGERLVAVGRKVTRPIVIPFSSRHRAIQVIIYGTPARCYISKPIRILKEAESAGNTTRTRGGFIRTGIGKL
jgi:hypothetical protein